jgi:hypothetical protein
LPEVLGRAASQASISSSINRTEPDVMTIGAGRSARSTMRSAVALDTPSLAATSLYVINRIPLPLSVLLQWGDID